MNKLPYLAPVLQKALERITKKGTVNLATHGSNFHADDICTTATLKKLFSLAYPKVKIKITRNLVQKNWEKGDIVYDIGMIYDLKTLRFDHHQTGGAGTYPNGIKYSSFGLVWKHFGTTICALSTKALTGKVPSKKVAERQAEIIVERVVAHVDAMDNGQMTYKALYPEVDVFTIDGFFEMCKVATSGTRISNEQVNKLFDKQFLEMVKVLGNMLDSVLTYAHMKEQDEMLAVKAYQKSKDKRVVVCDRFYYFNYARLPEPLVVVYPDTRNGWAAKVVRKNEHDFEARFYFPKEWAGKRDEELEKITGVPGARFCHNACFLVVADTKEHILQMIKLAFNE